MEYRRITYSIRISGSLDMVILFDRSYRDMFFLEEHSLRGNIIIYYLFYELCIKLRVHQHQKQI